MGLVLGSALLAGPAQAVTFTVNSTADADDPTPDGTCDSNPGPGVVCTLREALREANALAGTDTIDFNIPPGGPQTIAPASALPSITSPVIINGTTQPGYVSAPIIELDGTGAGASFVLNLGAGSAFSTIRGLVINRSPGNAIRIFSSNNVIAGNYLGTNLAGTLASGNAVGVYVQVGGNFNRIGGTTAADRNVISGNTVDGIQLDGTGGGANNNLVQGNYIGLNAAGTAGLGNSGQGVSIFSGPDNNTIGGDAALGAGNVISANNNGIAINSAGTTGNLVQGNLIGTDRTGTVAIGNLGRGVSFDQSSTTNTVGGTAPGLGNTIAYNGSNGVWMGGALTTRNAVLGNAIFANGGLGIDLNANGVDLNDTGDGDAGSNNTQNHPVLSAAMRNGAGSVNFAGSLNGAASTLYRIEFFASSAVDPSGYGEGERYLGSTNVTTDAAGNVVIGVTLAAAVAVSENITATATDPSNNTSEFGGNVKAVGFLVVTTTADTVDGNTTSTSALVATPGADGRISLREAILATNATPGADTIRFGIPLTDANHLYYRDDAIPVSLTNVQVTTLADSATPSSPAIPDFDPDYPAGLTRSWYRIQPTSALPTIADAVILDASTQPGALTGGPVIELVGASAGAGVNGLTVTASSSTVRGLVVNGFSAFGIRIDGGDGNTIAGNYVGTDPAGAAALGNGIDGIYVVNAGANGAANNVIGGTVPADRNVVSGNARNGIQLSGTGTTGNQVSGNYVGTNAAGTAAFGNGRDGVVIWQTSSNTVGGTSAGAGNVISGNQSGIYFGDGTATGNLVQGNYLGTDATGTAALPNITGIYLHAANTTVGGTSVSARNVISGNSYVGVWIDGFYGSSGNLIQGNYVGLSATGTSLPNARGVQLYTGATNNTLGGTTAGAANAIAYNTNYGIAILDTSTGNSILANAVYSNGSLGIDLNGDGVTANDPLDPDTGPNTLLNFPLITAAFESGGTLTVNFKVDAPAGSYRIEFFKNPSGADASTFGEGEVFAASTNVTHPGGGALFYNHTFAGSIGDVITATTTACTDGAACAAFGSTSEFAKAMTAVTTSVKLLSFTAVARDQAVDLFWETGSELGNLGFHLYRSSSAADPYERITSAVIPGLGSSPIGASYNHRDAGLTNGVRYFYKLEDIETTGRRELHGPVSAIPVSPDAADGRDGAGGDGTYDPTAPDAKRVAYGDPSAVSLRVLEQHAGHALLELRTGGFYATSNEDGSVDLDIPSFEDNARPGQPAVPTRRAWVEAVAGRRVQITSVQALDPVSFENLRPAPASAPAIDVTPKGTVRAGRERRREGIAFHRGSFPRQSARVLGTAFQGETKKAELELAPLRWRPASGRLVLSRRLLVRVAFVGRESGETSLGGSRGRRPPPPRLRSPSPLVQLLVRDGGLYRVRFEDVFPGRRVAVSVSSLSLSRKGEPVAFFVDSASFGRGSSLYFLSEGASLTPDSQEAVYELAHQPGGLRMSIASAAPTGPATSFYWQRLLVEQNKTYQAGLLDAPALWLWDVLVSPVTKSYPFTVDRLASTSAPAQMTVWLQGTSQFEANPDHHIRVSLNGIPFGEASWDGKMPQTIEADISSGVLREGSNTLQIENVGDTGAAASLVLLDRFSLAYPRATSAVAGVLEGSFTESGTVEVAGLAAGSILLDTTEGAPRWLTGATAGPGSMSFRAETGRRYFAADPSALKAPTLRFPAPSTLRSTRNQADYLLVGPREFLPAAEPLLALRESQSLRTRAVAIEDVRDTFGHGEPSPYALKAFLSHAYHSWTRPSPRYVLLLGDATYDPKDYLRTGVRNRVPPFIMRTSYLWTASDPAYAALNGDDLLPDLALGRLPAQTLEEARILVDKVVAFEAAGRDFSGPAVLVADNPDAAGDFEANANEIAATILAGRDVRKVFLSEKGASTRTEITHALDRGASLLSYVGHGSIAVWASENVWNNLDVNNLAPQPQQPILLTMNCLNGFFHFPPLNSLAEQFLKAEGKGALAAFSPSGLSLDQPAHLLHEALLAEIASGRHERLGDAVVAAQRTYADSGAFPELLSIYHLFGDPALRLR